MASDAVQDATQFVPEERTLPILRRAVQKCHGCDLYRNATQAVFGELEMGTTIKKSKVSIMVIGEQPGDHEDREGRPFVGPAGKLLNKCLEEVEIDRRKVYVTNTVKHFKWEPRCIIPASSFFEWQKTAAGPKPKYKVSVNGRSLFGMAGVWSPWMNPKTELWEDTFAIITSEPNLKMSKIHDRQPIILVPQEYEEWLTECERLPIHLLRILQEDDLKIESVDAPETREIKESPQGRLFI